jgi:hypothetical protein
VFFFVVFAEITAGIDLPNAAKTGAQKEGSKARPEAVGLK